MQSAASSPVRLLALEKASGKRALDSLRIRSQPLSTRHPHFATCPLVVKSWNGGTEQPQPTPPAPGPTSRVLTRPTMTRFA